MALLLVVPAGVAEPLVREEGVVEVGTIEPTSSERDEGASSGHGSSSSSSGDRSACLIPWFGGCLFWFNEHWETERADSEAQAWYYRSHENVNMTGYYVEVLGGSVFLRVASGEEERGSEQGASGSSAHYARDYYENNLGFSEEHVDDSSWWYDDAASDASRVSRTEVDGGAQTDVVGGDAGLSRETDGEESSSSRRDGAGSNETRDTFFGIPLFAEDDEQSTMARQESSRFWNQTVLRGNVYLINPTDGSRIEIVGLRADQGNESRAGSHEGESTSGSGLSILGVRYIDESQREASEGDHSFFEEWLHLQVDLVNGTVDGKVSYEHGSESSNEARESSEITEVFGYPFGSSEETHEQASREWRDVSFRIDAAQGTGVVTLDAWDDSSRSERQSQQDTIVIIPIGDRRDESSSFHSDGVAFGLDVAGGALWFGGSYENRSSESSSVQDLTIDGAPVIGERHDESERSRGIYAGGGSQLLDSGASLYHENSSSSSYDALRFGGEEVYSESHEEQQTAYGGDANAGGWFVFSMSYVTGTSRDEFHLGGAPLGAANREHSAFNVGAEGDVEEPTSGGHVFSYSFSHEESSENTQYDYGGQTIGVEQTVSRESFSIIVLDGLAGAEASRDFSTTRISSNGEEDVEASQNSADAEASAGEASTGMSFLLLYVEASDAMVLMAAVATWCADPGTSLPFDLINSLPAQAREQAAAIIAIAAGAMCNSAVVPLPEVPCFLIEGTVSNVFAVAHTEAGILPIGGDVAQGLVGAGAGGYQMLSNELGCATLTLPEAARNPQPALLVGGVVTGTSDAVLAEAWTLSDGGRMTAYMVIDAVFNADLVPTLGQLPLPPAVPDAPQVPPS